MKNKKKILIGIGSLLAIVLVIGVSYALWTFNIAQEGVNTITSDCFKIEFTDKNAISLNNAYPIEDELGRELTPYTFTLTNVCNGSAKYQINLETMTPSGKKLPDKYLKANLSEGSVSKITTKLDKSINSELEAETTINGAVDAYKLVTGVLNPGETKEFNLRIWMHSDVTAQDEDSMNASFEGKISIISSYYEDNRGTLMAINAEDEEGPEDLNGGFFAYYDYYERITKIVIEDKLNRYETSEELIYDLSEEQDGSIMSYLVSNEDNETYTLYVESNGGIKANSNSSGLFTSFTKLESIDGLEYLDTSNVTNMSSMFDYCESLTNLDLSSFDTSNVNDMSYMFSFCSSLTNLDLSSFNTSNVTNMNSMFQHCTILTSLDLSDFNISNVDDMSDMFNLCSSLTNLDLSSFNTSNVTNMNSMFQNCTSLTSLDLSNFDTSKVTNMSYMFCDCSSLTDLDVSHFDTSNVNDMSLMFKRMPSEAKIYVKDATTQNWILNLNSTNRPLSWTTDNVIVKA